MFVLKNGHAPELSGANCHAKLSRSKQLLKKYSSDDVSTILLTNEKIITVVTLKNLKNHQRYATAATKKKDVTTKRLRTRSVFRHAVRQSLSDGIRWRVTNGQENTSLILVFHRAKSIEGCYRNVMLL